MSLTAFPNGISNVSSNKAMVAGTGVTTGTGTVYRSGVVRNGDIVHTQILLDLTGCTSADSDLDVIGVEDTALVCHIGQITAERNGTIVGGTVTCLEAPLSLVDVDFYSADLGTYVYESLITGDATDTALVTRGGTWADGDVRPLTLLPAADQYIYACNGAADTPDIFTTGIFLIDLYGTV